MKTGIYCITSAKGAPQNIKNFSSLVFDFYLEVSFEQCKMLGAFVLRSRRQTHPVTYIHTYVCVGTSI